jgi:hypothetical protein
MPRSQWPLPDSRKAAGAGSGRRVRSVGRFGGSASASNARRENPAHWGDKGGVLGGCAVVNDATSLCESRLS